VRRLPKALWVIPVSDLGGVARHVLDVAALGIPGWEVVVLVPPGALADRCVDRGVPVLVEAFGPTYGAVASMRTLRRIMGRVRPALVHSHLAFADIVAAVVAEATPAGLVSTEHGIARDDVVFHGTRARSRAMAAVHRVRVARTDAVIGVSESTLEEVRAKWHPRATTLLRLVRNGVDPIDDAERTSPAPGLRIGALTRLAPEKRPADLVDAFAIVHRDHPDATLRIAGIGPLEHDLRTRIRQLDLGRSVELCGFAAPAPFLESIDVLAQVSAWENCSYSLLDGLRAHAGLVATDVGGNGEMLPRRCLVAPGDAVATAACLVEQGLHPETRPVLPDDWPTVSQMCDELSTVYEVVIASHRARGRRRRGP
jgi:glycosyltransferase involved in cell wall biosynthesis